MKILQNTLPLLALAIFIFWNKGFNEGVIWFAAMIVILLICWVFWRILTGSWNIKKYSKNSLEIGTPKFKERRASFIKLFAKLWLIAIITVVAFFWVFIVIGKKYFN